MRNARLRVGVSPVVQKAQFRHDRVEYIEQLDPTQCDKVEQNKRLDDL